MDVGSGFKRVLKLVSLRLKRIIESCKVDAEKCPSIDIHVESSFYNPRDASSPSFISKRHNHKYPKITAQNPKCHK